MEKRVELSEGLSFLEEGIQKAKCLLDGRKISEMVTADEYMNYHACVYNMCNQSPPKYSEELYDRFKETVENSINTNILPCLAGKTEYDLMIEFTSIWMKYKKFANTLSSFFAPVNKSCNRARDEPLYELALRCFGDVVGMQYIEAIVNFAASMITRDRNGEAVDRKLLKSISSFFMEIRGKSEIVLRDHFEKAVITSAIRDYSQLALQWNLPFYSTQYVVKVEKCLLEEKERASQTLYKSLENKLLKELDTKLFSEGVTILKRRRED